MIYLAIPYSNPREEVQSTRFEVANQIAAHLMGQGKVVFSPISHSVPVAKYLREEDANDLKFWMGQDLPMLQKCDTLVIVTMEGWRLSPGLARELSSAMFYNLKIEWLDPLDVVHPIQLARHDRIVRGQRAGNT